MTDAGQCENGAMESAWEMSKENVKPIRSGRKVDCISAVLKPSTVDMERLINENRKFEEEIFTQDNLEDPLDPWDRYLKWTIQNFPKGMNEGNLQNLLKNFIGKFQNVEKYKNDPRYINAWLTLAENCTDKLETYSYMHTQGIGTKFSLFYIAWAEEFVKCGDLKKAERIYSTGDDIAAEPRDLLQQKHSEFQLVMARQLLMNSEQVEDNDGSIAVGTNSNDERAVLGGLKGRGKKQVVGSQRTGRAMQGFNTINVQQAPLSSLNKKSSTSKFQVYEDVPRDHVMGEMGQWASMPLTSGEKENTKKAGPWAAVRPKKNSTSSDQQCAVVEPSKSNFAIYRDDEDSANTPASRQVASNIETILHEKKASANPSTSLQTVLDRPQHDSKTISNYCVDKVYSVMGEMQLEEIRAIFWRHRKTQREEAQKKLILQWTDAVPRHGDLIKNNFDHFEHQKQRLEKERQLLEEQRKMLEREHERVELEKEKLAKLKEVLPFRREKQESAALCDPEMMMYFKSENAQYIKEENIEDDYIKLPEKPRSSGFVVFDETSQGEKEPNTDFPFLQTEKPRSSGFVVFDETSQGEKEPNTDFPFLQTEKPRSSGFVVFDETSQGEKEKNTDELKLKIIGQSEASNASLNHSRRSQPSPTIYTKEALGEVLHWFQNPLPDEEYTNVIPDMINLPPSAESERIILSNRVKNIDVPQTQTSTIQRQTIAQPVASLPTSSEDCSKMDANSGEKMNSLEIKGKEDATHFFERSEYRFDDATVTSHHFAANARLASTPFCGKNKHRGEDESVFASLSHIDAAASVTENRTEEQMQEEEDEEEKRNACANQLSPIMEASNESEKSSMMTAVPPESGIVTRSTSESNWPDLDGVFSNTGMETSDVGLGKLIDGLSQDTSNDYLLCDTMNFDLWPSKTPDSKQTEVPVSKPANELSGSMEASTPTAKESLESSEETNTYVDTLCGGLECSNLNDNASPLPKEKATTAQINVIHDPWDEKLSNSIMKNFSICNLDAYSSNKILPKIRKGSILELGQRSYKVGNHIADGAFAKVYEACPLKKDSERNSFVLKIQNSPSRWELYAVKESKSRLLQAGRTWEAEAILDIASAHFFFDSSIFILPFLSCGTLLDIINRRKEKVVPNDVAIWIALTLMRIIHGLHTVGFIHGDVKPDNFMIQIMGDNVRILAIDFGRAIDMRSLPDNVTFMKTCKTSGFECIQMKEGQPWNYHTDFYGLAGILHVILFGKYMQVQNKNGIWSLTNKFKRFYDDVTWTDFFRSLLNCHVPTEEQPFTLTHSPLPRLISNMESIMSDMNHGITKIINFFSQSR